MKRLSMVFGALALLLTSIPATAQDKLVVSIWGGSWRDMREEIRQYAPHLDYRSDNQDEVLEACEESRGDPDEDDEDLLELERK